MPRRRGSAGPRALSAIGRALGEIGGIIDEKKRREEERARREEEARISGMRRNAEGIKSRAQGREAGILGANRAYQDLQGKTIVKPEAVKQPSASEMRAKKALETLSSELFTDDPNQSLLGSLSDKIIANLTTGNYRDSDILSPKDLKDMGMSAGGAVNRNDPKFERLWRLGMKRAIASLASQYGVLDKAALQEAATKYIERNRAKFGFGLGEMPSTEGGKTYTELLGAPSSDYTPTFEEELQAAIGALD